MKYRDIIKIIEKDGWFIINQRGSHKQYKHNIKKNKVTIAGTGNKDIPLKTLKSILKQSEIKIQ